MKSLRPIAYGSLFGFILSRSYATDYDTIQAMFHLTDLHLMGVIGLAIAVASFGFFLLRRKAVRAADGAELALAPKPMQRGLILGSLLFGVGWALSGTCPGTALAQLGQGTLAAMFTLVGIFLGSCLHRRCVGSRCAAERPPA